MESYSNPKKDEELARYKVAPSLKSCELCLVT